jgi:HK97 gp10 family phage protein
VIKMDTAGFKLELAKKRAAIEEARRPAAQAGVQVLYAHARMNAPVSEKEHFFYGKSFKINGKKYGPFQPGNLRDSIYQAFSPEKSQGQVSTYALSFNRIKAPYGFMVELGTSRTPAHSFIGKTVHENGPQALEAMRVTFINRVGAA